MTDLIDRPNQIEQLLQRIIDSLEVDIQDYTRLIHLTGMLREETDDKREVESNPILKERAECFKVLMVRSKQVETWQAEVCRQLGVESFTLKNLEGRVDPSSIAHLSHSISILKGSMTTLMELDEDLKTLLEQELEGTKLELHRLQGRRRLHQTYFAQVDPEARFIDKKK